MQQTSRLQAERQSWEQETHPNEQCEASGSQILSTEVRTCASGHVPKTVRTPRRRQMLVVRRRKQDSGLDAGTSLPPLQPMERPAENALERGGESDGMESGQMPTRASI
jgi:hypothetical protein